MATKALPGRAGTLYFSTNLSAATSAMTKTVELRDATLTVNRKTIDVTMHDSSGWSEFLHGIADWKIAAKVNYFSTAAGLKTVVQQLVASAPLSLRASIQSTTALNKALFIGNAKVTKFEKSLPTDKEILGTIELVGTGALSRTS